MNLLITGGCGFLGSNLVAESIRLGHKTYVIDNLYRIGSDQNLDWLKSIGLNQFFKCDLADYKSLEKIITHIKPDAIFHVAGQVAMTSSIENPMLDFQINTLGTLNLLEVIRKNNINCKIIYSSTNKVYGDLENLNYAEENTRYSCRNFPNGFDETLPLDFRTPYGCSKGSADQYIKDYAKTFNLKTIVFRHSSIFGSRQFANFNQGWIGWFIKCALEQKNKKQNFPIDVAGNGKQVRDILFASDLVECYFKALNKDQIFNGNIYNIGGGIKNSLSILELFDFLNSYLNLNLKINHLNPRASDQKFFVANINKAKIDFNWEPQKEMKSGLAEMIEWTKQTI